MNFFQINNFIKHWFASTNKGHGVHSPFIYQLCEEVFYNNFEFYHFKQLNKLRTNLLQSKQIINFIDYGAGSKKLKSNKRAISDITKYGISNKKQNEILFKLIHFLNCNTIIELGTSVGLNTLYLAMPNKENKIYTIEANNELCLLAKENAKKLNVNNITVLNNLFDVALPNLLNQLNTFDMLYVDGNHTYEATLNYFNLALQKINNKSIIVLDDIHWSKEMYKAWKEIKNNKNVKCSIDAFYFGILFFDANFIEKVEYKIKI
jgi:predicted O-methyltransferase YrrM